MSAIRHLLLAIGLLIPAVQGQDLLVASSGTNEVLRFDASTGAFLGAYVAAGSGGLQAPSDIQFGIDGQCLVVSAGTGDVLRYDRASGGFLSNFVPAGTHGLGAIGSLGFGPANRLLVAETSSPRVLAFNGWAGNHELDFIADDPASVGIDETGGLTDVRDLTTGPDGRLYLADGTSGSVFRYDHQTRHFIDRFVAPGSGGLSNAQALVFGPDRHLYVADAGSHSVLRFDRQSGAFLGTFVAAASGGLQAPSDLIFSAAGDLLVASQGTNEVLRYDGKTGAFLGVLVAAGAGGLSAPAALQFTEARSLKLLGPFGSAGVPTTLNLREGRSGQTSFILFALSPGHLGIPGCGGLFVDLANPFVIGSVVSNGAGWASFQAVPPPRASNLTIYLQAIELSSCRTSEVVKHRLPSAGAAAYVEIETGGSLKSGSTYNFGSFLVRNDSWGGQEITRVEIDLSESIYFDLVFDPTGQAGDSASKGFTVDFDAGTGVQGHSYAGPHDLGYDSLRVDFNGFSSGEYLRFSVDTDPTSIRGSSPPGPNESGSVSGLELSGARVRVFFDDGSILSSRTQRLGSSVTGSSLSMGFAEPAAPGLSLLGLSSPGIVNSPSQTARITGPIGYNVRLLALEGGLYTSGVPGGGFDLDPFEVNTVVAVQEWTGTIGTPGFVDIPITLTKTAPEAGITCLQAIIEDPQGRKSAPSPTWTVQYQ